MVSGPELRWSSFVVYVVAICIFVSFSDSVNSGSTVRPVLPVCVRVFGLAS